jgi:hypothetical protein
MALAWKAGWVNSPRGFESRILRQMMQGLTCANVVRAPNGLRRRLYALAARSLSSSLNWLWWGARF